MSIPGKVLIALLCALAAAAAFSTLNPELPLLGLLPPTALAALAAVLLSHRALPVPSALADSPSEAVDRAPPSSSAQKSKDARGQNRNRSDESGSRNRNRQKSDKRREPKQRSDAKPEKSGSGESQKAPSAPAADLEEGTVKWFNVTKGYGFIIRGNGEEIFVHHRSVQGEGRGRLDDGAPVRFRVANTDKGPQAEDVQAV